MALAPVLLGTPDVVGPWLLITIGVWFGAFAVLIVKDMFWFYSTGETLTGHELEGVPEDRIREEKPFAVLVPVLVTASWVLILVGVIWLAFVDWRIALGAVAVGVLSALWWRSRRPKQPAG